MALPITITDAGRAEIINAQNTGTGPVTITEIGFGTGQYSPLKTHTALQTQVKRVGSVAGQAVAADTIHVMALDESSDAYNVGEFGLFSDKGTLIAVYSQPAASGWIIQKAGPSTLLLATDIILESLDATSITFGDISFINPPATTTTQGVVELATPEETQTGLDGARAVTPAGLKSLTGTTSRAGLVQLNNTLASSSTSQALTAAQGKELQDKKQPLDPTLTALAALVTAANKLIYATGIDTFGTTDLSAFARTLLDDPNAAAALATLGAAPIDSAALTGNPTAPTRAASDNGAGIATTAFVRAAMGMFGFGQSKSLGNVDLNTVIESGFYRVNMPTNGPADFAYSPILVINADDTVAQVAISHQTGDAWIRGAYPSGFGWGAWNRIWTSRNLTKQEDAADSTVGAVMSVGAFGLGGAILNLDSPDLNEDRPTGFYYCNSPLNAPTASNGFLLHQRFVASAYATQTFCLFANPVRIYQRTQLGAASWTAWVEYFHSGNVSTFVQQLLDDPDAVTARATLGANNGSNINAGTVRAAYLDSAVRGASQGAVTQDPNQASDPVIVTDHANTPAGGWYWHITTTYYAGISSGSNRGQIAVSYNQPTTQVWARSHYQGVWTPWVRCDLGARPANTALLAVNGWHRDGDTGLIEQWGEAVVPADGTLAITFPVTFPNAFLQGLATLGSVFNPGQDAGAALINPTRYGATLSNGTQSAATLRWRAVGY
ncbi:gp53-like domain-containing protein [Stutzerimonas kunmingensis]|uniref:gp53-like domain-containing protein n=1 Tax=Stutzerimonas kunmingensis TaxID=1211807 RepID=UPI000CE4B9A2|nr:phage tail protein [Stutzerimonas kunmingensis]